MRESRGILNHPPGCAPNKFHFDKNRQQSSAFCGCCSYVHETQTEVYISPSEVLSYEHFLKESSGCGFSWSIHYLYNIDKIITDFFKAWNKWMKVVNWNVEKVLILPVPANSTKYHAIICTVRNDFYICCIFTLIFLASVASDYEVYLCHNFSFAMLT